MNEGYSKDFKGNIAPLVEEVEELANAISKIRDEKTKLLGTWREKADAIEKELGFSISDSVEPCFACGEKKIPIAHIYSDDWHFDSDIASELRCMKESEMSDAFGEMHRIIQVAIKEKAKLLNLRNARNIVYKKETALSEDAAKKQKAAWEIVHTIETLKAFGMINEGGFYEECNENNKLVSCELKKSTKYFIFKVTFADGSIREIHQKNDEFKWDKNLNKEKSRKIWFSKWRSHSTVNGCTDELNVFPQKLLNLLRERV